MRAIVRVLLVLVVFPAVAWAQPGAPPVGPGQPSPQPYPPQPYPPQPYPPQVRIYVAPYSPYPIQLTPDEQKLLSEGEISSGQHIGGVIANWAFGFGIGQLIQGRWTDSGWFFTLGEAATFGMMVAGTLRFSDCWAADEDPCDNKRESITLMVSGIVGYVVVHVWSIVDAVTGPASHNRKVREIKRRAGIPVLESKRIIPVVSPSRDGGGTVGLTFRF